ncbi:metallopeptidase family protein [Chloroflexota bacterium]
MFVTVNHIINNERIRHFRLKCGISGCRTPAEIEAEVRLTVLHEVGHFFGLEELQLEQL